MFAAPGSKPTRSPVRKATAATPMAPEEERVETMMANRRSLNANQRRAPRQDLSGVSPDGTITGRGGKVQRLGAAAMRRLPQPPTTTSTMVGGDPSATPGGGNDFMKRYVGGDPTSDAAQMVGAGPGTDTMMRTIRDNGMPGGGIKDMPIESIQPALQNPGGPVGRVGRGAPSAPPEMQAVVDRFNQLTPEQQRDSMVTYAAPGGGAPPGMPGAAPGQSPGGMPPDQQMADQARAAQVALAGAEGGGGGFNPGLPPAIMQRLSALRGGGMQGGAQGAPGGFVPPQRSFETFWAGGGQGMPR